MSGTNPSGLEPLEYNLIVKAEEVEEKTAGGLIIPQTSRDQKQWSEQRARVMAVSPAAFGFEGEGTPGVEAGDLVLIARHSGGEFTGLDGNTYWLIKDKDVLGKFEGAANV